MTMNYDISRARQATPITRDSVIIVINAAGSPVSKHLRDAIAVLNAGDIPASVIAANPANGTFLKYVNAQTGAAWDDIEESDLDQDIRERLLSSNANTAGQIMRYDGDAWILATIPDATDSERGIVELATQSELTDGTDNETAVTPRTLAEHLDGRIAPVPNRANSGRYLSFDSQGHLVVVNASGDGDDGHDGWTPVLSVQADGVRRVLRLVDYVGGGGNKPAITDSYVGASGLVPTAAQAVDIRGGTGAKGDSGDVGGSGENAYAQALYARTTGATPPQPTSASGDTVWNTTYTAPDATNTRAWLAFRSGSGSPSGAWQVILISEHSAGGGTPTPSTHRRWFAFGADSTFTASEMTAGISADGESLTVTGYVNGYIAVWSAQPLTFAGNPTLGLENNQNVLTTVFRDAVRLTISTTNGYLYVSRQANYAANGINQTWTFR